MNKSYVIAPVILMALFGFFYNGALNDMKIKEEGRLAKIAATEKAEADRKAEVEKKATAEALKKQEERAAADKAKEDKKEKDYQDAMDQAQGRGGRLRQPDRQADQGGRRPRRLHSPDAQRQGAAHAREPRAGQAGGTGQDQPSQLRVGDPAHDRHGREEAQRQLDRRRSAAAAGDHQVSPGPL